MSEALGNLDEPAKQMPNTSRQLVYNDAPGERFLTIPAAATYLHLSRDTIYRLIRNGNLDTRTFAHKPNKQFITLTSLNKIRDVDAAIISDAGELAPAR